MRACCASLAISGPLFLSGCGQKSELDNAGTFLQICFKFYFSYKRNSNQSYFSKTVFVKSILLSLLGTDFDSDESPELDQLTIPSQTSKRNQSGTYIIIFEYSKLI